MKCTSAGVELADQMYEGTDSCVMVTVPAPVCLKSDSVHININYFIKWYMVLSFLCNISSQAATFVYTDIKKIIHFIT